MFVKEAFRKFGIAKKLLEEIGGTDGKQSSHLTYGLIELWTNKKTDIPFNPYLLEEYDGRKD